MADYTCLFEAEGMPLYLGKDQTAPLIAEGKPLPLISVLTSHLISSCYYWNLFCFKLYSFLQAFNNICLTQYVHQLADQLHADAMQQLGSGNSQDPSG